MYSSVGNFVISGYFLHELFKSVCQGSFPTKFTVKLLTSVKWFVAAEMRHCSHPSPSLLCAGLLASIDFPGLIYRAEGCSL